MSHLTPEQTRWWADRVAMDRESQAANPRYHTDKLGRDTLVAVDERLGALERVVRALVEAPDAGYPEETNEPYPSSTCLYCGCDYDQWQYSGEGPVPTGSVRWETRYVHAPDCPIHLARALLEAATAAPSDETTPQPI